MMCTFYELYGLSADNGFYKAPKKPAREDTTDRSGSDTEKVTSGGDAPAEDDDDAVEAPSKKIKM